MDNLQRSMSPYQHEGHPNVQNWKKFRRSKQRKSPNSDVTVSCEFVDVSSISDFVNTHRLRRRIKGYCGDHLCLYKFLRFSYKKKSFEDELIRNILEEIYLCEGNLHSIFSILLPGHVWRDTSVRILYPGFASEKDSRKHYQAFEYYLKKLCSIRSFNNTSTRTCDIVNMEFDNEKSITPLLAATQTRNPYLVLLLLRYGADPYRAPRNPGSNSNSDPISSLISGLNSVCMFKNMGLCAGTKAVLLAEENKGLMCLQFFFRTTEQIPLVQNRHFVASDYEEEEKTETKVYSLHPRLAESLDLPNLSGPRPLEHLCRVAVREHLKCTSGTPIPSLIKQLPLPKPLQLYLDLLRD